MAKAERKEKQQTRRRDEKKTFIQVFADRWQLNAQREGLRKALDCFMLEQHKKRSMNIKRQKLDEFLKKILSLMYRHQQKHDPAHAAAHAKSFKLIYCKYCSGYFGIVVCFHPAAFMSRQ